MDKQLKIGIIGGGIAGLSTALALEKKGFYNYAVYEAKSEIREVGAGLWLAPNAMNIMERIGISDELLNTGMSYDSLYIENWKGERLMKHDVNQTKEKFGNGITAFKRPDLIRVLKNNVPVEKIQTNKRCVKVDSDGLKSKAFFEDGKVEDFDLIIGSDGIGSCVRNFIGEKATFRYSGQTCWRCILDTPTKYIEKEKYMSELWGKEKGVRIGIGPVTEKESYYYITTFSNANEKDNPETVLSEVMKVIKDFPKKIQDMVAVSKPENILRNDLSDFKPLKKWTKENVVILGDAAHATTPNLGQGACQAIESAYIIAEELSKGNELSKCLTNYEKKRIDRAAFITNTSWSIGISVNLSGFVGNLIKFGVMKYMPKSLSEKQFNKIYKLPY